VSAQEKLTGRIRGTVTDAASGQALPYVQVLVAGTSPAIGALTDGIGMFRLPELPVSERYTLHISYVGYEPVTVRQIAVTSAKETILAVSLKESIQMLSEVVVTPKVNKSVPLNNMTLTGARMVSIEEASRFAGGIDDPGRLMSSFAGVASGGAGTNNIAIRGNSPQFLQWKLEGVEIPNPNHFPESIGVGGGILTAFSTNVMDNSDFYTGAFPAEYDNALAGVYDMKLRTGNNLHREHSVQIGTLGVELSTEGPFGAEPKASAYPGLYNKAQHVKQTVENKASYLINYRASTLRLSAELLGGALEQVAGMRYQDWTYKFNFPTRRAGTFTLWGIGTYDNYNQPLPKDLANTPYLPYTDNAHQTMNVAGLTHRIYLSSGNYLNTILTYYGTTNHRVIDLHDLNGNMIAPLADIRLDNTSLILHSFFNSKINARLTNRFGFTLTNLWYDDDLNIVPYFPYSNGEPMQTVSKSSGNSMVYSVFNQTNLRIGNRWSLQMGINTGYFKLNNELTIEPRAALKWQSTSNSSLALAYGLHSRRENLEYYFVEHPLNRTSPNKNLKQAKAHHLVLTYDWNITDNLHFKAEPYYQELFDVPVQEGTPFSIINQQYFWMTSLLVNSGKGRNYGIDLTLERYLLNGYYYMITASLFDSRYRGGDGKWRNTMLNRRYVTNVLGGKEWFVGKTRRNVLGVNLRFNFMGGDYYTPFDAEQSVIEQRPIEDTSQTMSRQHKPVFVAHAGINFKMNRRNCTHEVAFKIINATGHADIYGYNYNFMKRKVTEIKARIIIPNVYYKMSF
ncbi:MAG: TonB-dependent receptor, partial [Mediterranea sp.]|nr:TonB-dependent receptor [Mediterranea sp.]